jgi:hypothetical protein
MVAGCCDSEACRDLRAIWLLLREPEKCVAVLSHRREFNKAAQRHSQKIGRPATALRWHFCSPAKVISSSLEAISGDDTPLAPKALKIAGHGARRNIPTNQQSLLK